MISPAAARSALLALMLSAPGAVAAQNYREVEEDYPPPRYVAAINFQLAFPQGEFKDFVGTGYGLGGHITFFLDRRAQTGVRLFGSWIQYGRTTERLPLSPTLPGLLVDLTTENNIYSFGADPNLCSPPGRCGPM